jgi:diaminopimelate decarboxylase
MNMKLFYFWSNEFTKKLKCLKIFQFDDSRKIAENRKNASGIRHQGEKICFRITPQGRENMLQEYTTRERKYASGIHHQGEKYDLAWAFFYFA